MSTFDYRRRLDKQELIKLAGGVAGAGAGLAAVLFYLGRIWLQRVPLDRPGARRQVPPDPALGALGGGVFSSDRQER